MNANELFEKYSIEEINKRTKISPISLRYIKNREFEKIQRVKFMGFIKILEKEFGADLSELISEYNSVNNIAKEVQKEEVVVKKQNTFLIISLALILFLLGAYLLYVNYTSSDQNKTVTKSSYNIANSEENVTHSKTVTETNSSKITTEQNTSTVTSEPLKLESPVEKEIQKTVIPQEVKIIPNKKVWFKAVNLDTHKTKQYLTSHPKTFKGSNWYFKFGHGDVIIKYGDKTVSPKTKRILRVLVKDGNITFLQKNNRYEK